MTLSGKRIAPEELLPAVLLLLVVAAGLLLRFDGLADQPLRADELNHLYVAESVRDGGGPVLPSGEYYVRGLSYSRLVAVALAFTGAPELATRLPSALFGSLLLILFAAIAWRLGGAWMSLWSTALMAVFPIALEQSRNGRFYTMQLTFGLIALYAGWMVVRRAGSILPPDRAMRRRAWFWAFVTLGSWAACVALQITTLSVAAAWFLTLAAAAAADLQRWRSAALRTSVPLQLLLVLAAGVLVFLAANPGLPAFLWARMLETPYWARAVGSEEMSYARAVLTSIPPLGLLTPLAFFVMVRRRPRLGSYLLVWFLVPLAVHELMPWKATRFVLLALPAMLLALAYAISYGLGEMRKVIRRVMPQRAGLIAEVGGRIAVGALAIPLLVNPSFVAAARAVGAGEPPEWRLSGEVLRERGLERVPVGHASSLPALHYWGRLDFTVNEGLRERWVNENERARFGLPPGNGYAELPMGAPDLYTGAPVLASPESIRTHFGYAGAVLIGIDPDRATIDGVRPELLEVLETRGEELCQGRCGRMRLYLWAFDPPREVAGMLQ